LRRLLCLNGGWITIAGRASSELHQYSSAQCHRGRTATQASNCRNYKVRHRAVLVFNSTHDSTWPPARCPAAASNVGDGLSRTNRP
jgi:hypothetical protein